MASSRILKELNSRFESNFSKDMVDFLKEKGIVIEEVSERAVLFSEQEISKNPLYFVWRNNYHTNFMRMADTLTDKGSEVRYKFGLNFLLAIYSEEKPSVALKRKVKKQTGIDLSRYD